MKVLLALSAAFGIGLIVWVLRYGWRSLFGMFRLRTTVVLEFDDQRCLCPPGGMDYSCKPCRAEIFGDRADIAVDRLLARLTAEDADILLWEDELSGEPGIRRYERRMDRWSQ